MTLPATGAINGQQARLTFATALGACQSYVTYPLSAASMASGSGEAIALENKNFASADAVIQDVVNCNGTALADRIIDTWSGSWSMEFFATSRWLGWALSMAWGSVTSAGAVSASNAVFTLTIGATGGTQYLYIEGKKTAEFAYNDSAANIQTAINNAVGSGRWTVAGTGGSRTITATAAGPLDSVDIGLDQVGVQTAKLTGGSNVIALTTPGGPARSTYTIAQDSNEQGPATSGVLGYSGVLAVRLADLSVDTLRITREDAGLYRVSIGWKWSGIYDILTGFTFPACATAKYLKKKQGGFKIGSTSHSKDVKAWEYNFGASLQPQYVDVSSEPQAQIRSFPLTNTLTAEFEEDASLSTSVTKLITQGGQYGTKTSVEVQVGSPGDGAKLTVAESLARLNNTLQTYGGTPARGRVPAAFDPLNSDGDAAKPVSATLVTSYSGGYLNPA